jgi:hypothetical protein
LEHITGDEMQTMYAIVINGKTLLYPTMDEAIKMAKWAGWPVAQIKEVHLY